MTEKGTVKRPHRPLRFGNDVDPAIWMVDDAWFGSGMRFASGSRGGIGLFRDILPVPAESDRSLPSLLAAIERHTGEHFDAACLQIVASLCVRHTFSLVLADFDHLHEEFGTLNQSPGRAALLVDFWETGIGRDSSGRDGAMVLADCLGGKAPRLDVFFFTSRAQELHDAITKKSGDERWWPLRFVPLLLKLPYDNSERRGHAQWALQKFAGWFAERCVRDRRGWLYESFGRTLQHTTHPDTPEQMYPKCVLLDGMKGHLQSYKALFHYRTELSGEDHDGRGLDPILSKVLKSHLEYAGLRCISVTGRDELKLPVQPGVRFIVALLEFLHGLDSGVLNCVSLNVANNGCELSIAMQDGAAKRLFAAFHTGSQGGSTTRLREFVACSRHTTQRMVASVLPDEEKPELAKRVAEWITPRDLATDDHRPVEQPLLQLSLKGNLLVLRWPYEECRP